MNRKILFLIAVFSPSLGRGLWAQDSGSHAGMHHDMPSMKQGAHQDADPGEPPGLHEAVEQLPDHGGNFHEVYHKHADLYRIHPEIQSSLLYILKSMVEMNGVKREIKRAEKEGGDHSALIELKRRREDIRQHIDNVMDDMAADPVMQPIHHELMGNGMEKVYHDLGFRMDVDKYQKKDPSASAFDYGAQQKLEQKDWDGAYHDADHAVALDPRDARALALRAAALYQMGDIDGARRDAQSALQIDPKNQTAFTIAKLTEGRIPAVNAPALSPEFAPAPAPEAVADYAGSGTHSAADPKQSEHYAEDAAHFLRMRDFSAGIAWAGRALDADHENARAYDLRAMGYMGLGQYELAANDALSALRLIPNDRLALDALARAYNRLREYEKAKTAAEKALANDPGDAEAWYSLAYAEAGEGHRDSMLAALKKAAELNPDRFAARYEKAVQAPSPEDLTLLFSDSGPATSVMNPMAQKESGRRRNLLFLLIVIASVVGGALIALGLYHVLFAPRKGSGGRVRVLHGASADSTGMALGEKAAGLDGIGRVLSGKFRIARQIGSGGMGKVYEAIDLHLERPVAIKRMREELETDLGERERFLKEAKTVAALHHPNIVEIYSIIEEKKNLYLVFELVRGNTLTELLRARGSLPFGEVLAIMKDVCAALDYAHGRGIIHRDLKPSNMMKSEYGVVKVMDFGVARQAKEAMSRLSMISTVSGTPPYMAPEAEQGVVSKEADIYSLGICLYELLAGQLPFGGNGAGMLLNKMNATFKPLSKIVPGLPERIDDLMSRVLAPEPDRRIKSAGEFLKILESLSR